MSDKWFYCIEVGDVGGFFENQLTRSTIVSNYAESSDRVAVGRYAKQRGVIWTEMDRDLLESCGFQAAGFSAMSARTHRNIDKLVVTRQAMH